MYHINNNAFSCVLCPIICTFPTGHIECQINQIKNYCKHHKIHKRMHRCYRECAYMRGISERLRSVITTSRSDTNPRLPYLTLPAHGNDSYTLNDF